MKEEGKKKIARRKYIGKAAPVLVGVVCGLVIGKYAGGRITSETSLGEVLFWVAGLALGLYAVSFCQIVIHEAGHLFMGLLTGYQFVSFRIGSRMWIRKEGRLQCKKMVLAGTGGQCLLAPPNMKDGKMPYVLYNLGGPLANLISAPVFWGFSMLLKPVWMLSALMGMFAIVGLLYALVNGIPMRMGALDNDGYNALSLGKDPDALYSLWVQLKVNEQNAQGVRIKDMPEEWFDVPQEEKMKNSMISVLGVLACNRLMDLHEFEKADSLMERMLQGNAAINGIYKNLLELDRIFCELMGEKRSERLNGMMGNPQKKFMKSMKTFPSVLRTEFAWTLLMEKNRKKADEMKRQFEKIEKTYPYPADMESERELMELAAAREDQ